MTVRAACIAGAVLASVAVAPAHAQPAPTRSATELMDVLMWNREPVGGPFRLVDHTGTPRSDADFHGKLVLLYFGFTYCPDLCPTDLATMGVLVEKLGKAGESLQPLFVTLDPERDTAERLASYVTFFHPRLIGLTARGTPYVFARNNLMLDEAQLHAAGKRVAPRDYRAGEFAGACFDPRGRVLFVNIQRPGITFAIWGPWSRGPL